MVYWLVAIIIIVLACLILVRVKKRKTAVTTDLQTHKPCAYCNEEIEVDAVVCKYCRGVVVSSG